MGQTPLPTLESSRDRVHADGSARRPAPDTFAYDAAFSRNIGWVTAWEQQALRRKRVAIAGLGGVGGSHLLTLARLGIGAFNIADFDRFELANMNRQAGAGQSALGRPKVDVLAGMAANINPELDLRVFPDGLSVDNLDRFLDGVDLFVDGLDFFALDIRARVFARCAGRGIPAVTAAPIGMGAAFLVFMPGGMTFEQYFRLEGLPREERLLHFLIGLTPRAFQRSYLMDPSRVDFAAERGPSTAIACELCAGVAAAESLKILLGRGPVRAAPRYHQFDAYTGRWTAGWLPWGNRNPLQRLRRAFARRTLARLRRNPQPAELPATASAIERILDAARWAPSGDNMQPWRFVATGDDGVAIEVAKSADVYDFDDGRPTLLAAGFLLESLRIAASGVGHATHWTLRSDTDAGAVIDVRFARSVAVRPDPLHAVLAARSVDRRRYRATPLTEAQKSALAAALGPGFAIRWLETPAERLRAARLNARATDIRLRIKEAFDVHRRILDWERDFSPDRVPVRAVGLSAASVQAMRLFMRAWRWMDFGNRFLGATALSRLELDLVPGLLCGAHFVISRAGSRHDADATLRAGQALQRFWLTATALSLVLQPSLATICFAYYGADGAAFSGDAGARRKAKALAAAAEALVPGGLAQAVFMGRIGVPTSRRIRARSVRRPLAELLRAGS